MASYTLQNDYDFVITAIGHVTERKPNVHWHIEDLVNHDYHILAFAMEGEAIYRFDNQEYHIQKGDLLFFPKGMAHSAFSSPSNPWSFYSITFDVAVNDASEDKFNSLRKLTRSPNLYPLPSLLSELNHVWTGKRSGYLIKCRSLLMEVLYLLIRDMDSTSHNTSHYTTIERILNMIHANYMNTYTIEDLSKLSGLSSSHFRLLFKKVTGLTVVQYQNSIKINKARDLLLSGDCNVTEAALSVGFNDIYYFSRLFKKITGSNPSEYL